MPENYSLGTIKGQRIIQNAIIALKNGGYLIIDELENHLNKELVKMIIGIFNDEKTNKKGACIIFTTHYAEILDSFDRKDNIYVLTRDKNNLTSIQKYSDVVKRNELKKSEVILSNYIKGSAPKALNIKELNVGKRSKTDVVISYIKGIVDDKLISEVKDKINKIDTGALVMGEKSLDELLIKKHWYNPLPKVKFTERPDVVAAHLMEGHIAIIVDTSPSVMILPATMFHFTQHAEDYYQNISVGTYLRWVRFLGMICALILPPLCYLLVEHKEILPEFLQFIGPKESGKIPIIIQFICWNLA